MTNSEETHKQPGLRERRSDLRKVREAYELSLDELAKMSGLSKSMISKFELGHRRLSASALGRLEKALTTLAAKRVTNAIGAEDSDFLAYMDILRDEPELHQMIGRVVHVGKKDLRRRDMMVEALRRLSSKQKNQFVKQWYEAERDALLAFKKIGELDARFKLALGAVIVERFTVDSADQLEEEIWKVREQWGKPNG